MASIYIYVELIHKNVYFHYDSNELQLPSKAYLTESLGGPLEPTKASLKINKTKLNYLNSYPVANSIGGMYVQ